MSRNSVLDISVNVHTRGEVSAIVTDISHNCWTLELTNDPAYPEVTIFGTPELIRRLLDDWTAAADAIDKRVTDFSGVARAFATAASSRRSSVHKRLVQCGSLSPDSIPVQCSDSQGQIGRHHGPNVLSWPNSSRPESAWNQP